MVDVERCGLSRAGYSHYGRWTHLWVSVSWTLKLQKIFHESKTLSPFSTSIIYLLKQMGDKAIVNIDFQGIKAAPHVTLRLVVNDAAFAAQKTKLLLLEHSNRATGKNVTWATRLSPSQVVAVRLLASPPPGSASSFKSLKDAAEFFHRNTNSRKAASGVAATGKESGGCCWLSVHALLFNSSSSSLSSAAAPTYMDFIVEFESETAANLAHNTLSAWASATLDIFNGESPRPALTPTPTPAQSIRCIRKVLVLINPFGGKKMAKKIYETGGPAYLFASKSKP